MIIALAGRKGPVDLEVVFQVSRNAQNEHLEQWKVVPSPIQDNHESRRTVVPRALKHGRSDPSVHARKQLRIMEVRTVPMVTRVRHAIVAPVVEGEDAEAW